MPTEQTNALTSRFAQHLRQQATQPRTADLEGYVQMLQGRDRLFEATAAATKVLLTLENLDEAINAALEIFLQESGCDRIKVLENCFDASSISPNFSTVIYERVRPGIFRQMSHLASRRTSNEGIEAFLEQYFLKGDGFSGLLDEWVEPLRSAMAAFQVKSSCSVPIRVNGKWWGMLALNYCQAEVQINPAEFAVLRTIADCIGSAIQRDRTQQALLEAEQHRSAELSKANTAMRRSIDWLAHEPEINAFLGHLLEELAAQVVAQDAVIFLYDAQEHTLQPFVGVIDDEITFSPPLIRKFSAHGWLGWDVLLRSPNPIHFDMDTEPHLFLPEYLEYHRRRNNQGIVCTLLQQGDEPLGLIRFGCVRKTLSENELVLVQSLAQQATLAIQLTRLAEEAKQAALLQERTRMAQEIHDTLAQAFGGILMQLQAANCFAANQPEKAQTHLLTAQTLAQDGLTEARRSVWTLYLETSEYENPAQTIAKFIEQTMSRQSVPIDLAIDGSPYRLHPDLGLNLLRIAQEAIANALRHAQAQTIQVRLNYSPQTLQLTIRDDGCGFEPQSPSSGFGLLGMQQRAAKLGATWQLASQLGQGATITVFLVDPATP